MSLKIVNQTSFFRGNDLDMNVEGAWRQGITGKGKLNKILFSWFNQDLIISFISNPRF